MGFQLDSVATCWLPGMVLVCGQAGRLTYMTSHPDCDLSRQTVEGTEVSLPREPVSSSKELPEPPTEPDQPPAYSYHRGATAPATCRAFLCHQDLGNICQKPGCQNMQEKDQKEIPSPCLPLPCALRPSHRSNQLLLCSPALPPPPGMRRTRRLT